MKATTAALAASMRVPPVASFAFMLPEASRMRAMLRPSLAPDSCARESSALNWAARPTTRKAQHSEMTRQTMIFPPNGTKSGGRDQSEASQWSKGITIRRNLKPGRLPR